MAAWLNSRGMTGIILKYRCPRRPGDIKGEPPLGPQGRKRGKEKVRKEKGEGTVYWIKRSQDAQEYLETVPGTFVSPRVYRVC